MTRLARFEKLWREKELRRRRLEYHQREIELSRLHVRHQRRMRLYVRCAAVALVAVTVWGML